MALHLRFRVMVYGWDDFDVPGSRFTNQAVFVLTVPETEEGDRIADAQMTEAVAAARGESEVRITAFRATYGRGASDSAIGLLVDLAIGFAPSVVAAVWMRIRHRRPIMSVGALRYLCMADLAQRLGLDSLDDVVEVVACDTAGARPPELNPVDIEPVLVVFTDRANTRSWVYLVSPRGHLLSFHEGQPMTAGLTYYRDISPPAKEPPLLLPDSGNPRPPEDPTRH